MSKTYKVNEIFYSIQGEGYNAGYPAVFVRFSGCNLACPFCDTDHSQYTEMTAEQIRQAVEEADGGKETMVVLTGGEPTIQITEEDCIFPLTCPRFIAIETNGLKPVPTWIDWVTVSPKLNTPVDKLPEFDEVKLLYDPQKIGYIQQFNRDGILAYIQPIERNGEYNFDECIQFVKDNPRFKLSVQTHKLVGMK